MKLPQIVLNEILKRVNHTVDLARTHVPSSTGGYFCFATHAGIPIAISLIGETIQEKLEKRVHICQEKALRLGRHTDHLSSFQSRDPDNEMWGGAIRVQGGSLDALGFIFSFTGFPELWDEAIMLTVAHKMFLDRGRCFHPDHMLPLEQAYKIAAISRNAYFVKIKDAE